MLKSRAIEWVEKTYLGSCPQMSRSSWRLLADLHTRSNTQKLAYFIAILKCILVLYSSFAQGTTPQTGEKYPRRRSKVRQICRYDNLSCSRAWAGSNYTSKRGEEHHSLGHKLLFLKVFENLPRSKTCLVARIYSAQTSCKFENLLSKSQSLEYK